jgi:hypothetical protein
VKFDFWLTFAVVAYVANAVGWLAFAVVKLHAG